MSEAAGIIAENGGAPWNLRERTTLAEPLQIHRIQNDVNAVCRNLRQIFQALTAAIIHGYISQDPGKDYGSFRKSAGCMAYEYGRHGRKLQQRFHN